MRRVFPAATLFALFLPHAVGAAEKEKIDAAIQSGVAALKRMQKSDGRWDCFATPKASTAATALAGLTLLECGVPKDDPVVQSAAKYVRSQIPTLRWTYALALSILFLDQLGDPADEVFITALAARLVAGQCPTGAWAYDCPDPTATISLLRVNPDVNPQRDKKDNDDSPREKSPYRRAFLAQVQALRPQATLGVVQVGDNSNTQFACLALWVARRHGLPVEESIRAIEARFRLTQRPDGGWSYPDLGMFVPTGGDDINTSTPTMTCAGLLGLAVGYGLSIEHENDKGKSGANKVRDKHLDAALRALSLSIGLPFERLPAAPEAAAGFKVSTQASGRAYYYLWGVERVAMILQIDTIGKKDWYEWGSNLLIATQRKDGSWAGAYTEGGADTSFALLFLAKANVARDLSRLLRGRVQDPGKAVLRGGFGNEALNQNLPHPTDMKPDSSHATNSGRPSLDGSNTGSKVGYLGTTPGAKLAEALIALASDRQEEEIDRLKAAKGTENTEALASAIPFLNPETRRKAREALASRVARMKPETIEDYLQDEEPEIRRAASLACAMKGTKQLIPRLIELLSDRDTGVARAAYLSLKGLTGQDFGPAATADDADRKRAKEEWSNWWKNQSR